MAYTLNILEYPVSALSGAVTGRYRVEVLNSGVRDTAPTITITVAKQSGNFTAGGTLTANCVAGVATFDLMTATRTSGNGSGIWRFTDATHSTFVDSYPFVAIPAAYTLSPGTYFMIPWRDPVYGTLQHMEIMTPAAVSPSATAPLFVYTNQSGYYNENFNLHGGSSVADGPSILRAASFWGQYVDSKKATTFPCISVSFPIELATTGSEDSKRGFDQCMNALPAFLYSLGYLIDEENFHVTGYSTGEHTIQRLLAKFPEKFAFMSGIDANWVSQENTHAGAGPDSYGPFPGYLYDAPGYADVAYALYFGAHILNSRTGFAHFGGTSRIGPGTGDWLENGTSVFTPYVRDIQDFTPLFDAIDTAAGYALTQRKTLSNTTSQLTAPYPRFYFERFNSGTHSHLGDMPSMMYSGSNADKLLALHLANPRRPAPIPASTPDPVRNHTYRFVIH